MQSRFTARRTTMATLLLAVMAAAACDNPAGSDGGGTPRPTPRTPVADVHVTPGFAELDIGAQVPLAARPLASNGTDLAGRGAAAWTSTDTTVVSVTADGRATARGAGTAYVNATIEGVTGRAWIEVRGPGVPPVLAARVQLDASFIQRYPGEEWQFTAIAFDAEGQAMQHKQILWFTTNADIASVDNRGRIVGHTAGRATIRAQADGVYAEATVEVVERPGPEPAPAIVWVQSVDGDTVLPREVFTRMHNGRPASVQLRGGYIERTILPDGGAGYVQALFLVTVQDGIWVDSETYFDEGTVERTDDGHVFRSTMREGFTFTGAFGVPDGVVVTQTLGGEGPVHAYHYAIED